MSEADVVNESTKVEEIDVSMNTPPSSVTEPVAAEETQPDTSLKGMLESYMQKSDGKLPLTMATKRMIVCLTNVPSDALEKIEKLVNKVFEDNTLDIQDAPQLMIIVQELFELYNAMEFKNLKPENCASVLKVVAHVLYVNKFSATFSDSESTVLLQSFNSIIDTSVMLISLKETIPAVKKCRLFWCA